MQVIKTQHTNEEITSQFFAVYEEPIKIAITHENRTIKNRTINKNVVEIIRNTFLAEQA